MANVEVSAAATIIEVTVLPGFAINTPSPQVEAVVASPQATSAQITTVDAQTIVNTLPSFNFGGVGVQPSITLNLGTQQDPVSVNQAFSNFNYKFPNFVDIGTSSFTVGDIVFFQYVSGYNLHNVKLTAIDVNNESKGASNALFIFKGHTDGLLILMHKGFYDYESGDSRVDDWIAGRTTYINQDNKLDVGSDFTNGQWVRSIGFCVPNLEGKKRVWFAGDTTYIKLQN